MLADLGVFCQRGPTQASPDYTPMTHEHFILEHQEKVQMVEDCFKNKGTAATQQAE